MILILSSILGVFLFLCLFVALSCGYLMLLKMKPSVETPTSSPKKIPASVEEPVPVKDALDFAFIFSLHSSSVYLIPHDPTESATIQLSPVLSLLSQKGVDYTILVPNNQTIHPLFRPFSSITSQTHTEAPAISFPSHFLNMN